MKSRGVLISGMTGQTRIARRSSGKGLIIGLTLLGFCLGGILNPVRGQTVPGPVTTAATVTTCPGQIVSVPITVSNFNDVGSITLTLYYDKNVMTYYSFDNTPGGITFTPDTGFPGPCNGDVC
ncbi:MAG TPA: cohesin domain-containing protein, partial [Bacteroidales bacterium]|nr:cohesin domain-containing protein [Bacteroidales bacterium]